MMPFSEIASSMSCADKPIEASALAACFPGAASAWRTPRIAVDGLVHVEADVD